MYQSLISELGINIYLNKDMDYYDALITLNHELTIHAVRFAQIIMDNKGDIAKALELLALEKPEEHHKDITNKNSDYNEINYEIIDYFKEYFTSN